MSTNPSTLATMVTASRSGVAKEGYAQIPGDKSAALIFELSVEIGHRAALLEASRVNLAQSQDDLDALAWIQRSLEDVEATIIGLSEANGRSSVSIQGPAHFLLGTWSPSSVGPTGRRVASSSCG
jgi:hypothetical protein